ncbi:unnamed protein product [Lactuca virosa]|uniref:Uncharacterized protein n=1 Tax=Lactuca virosa TaxID=75947 RepID=A0AAU9P3T8_9ASTR|nr:unnamed protein product [Lactuca virosa]
MAWDGLSGMELLELLTKLSNFQIFCRVWVVSRMCFAGEESGREVLRKAMFVGAFDPNDVGSTSSHSGEMVDAIDSFLSCDYASMMKLGSLDIGGLRQLCADDDNEGAGPSSNNFS